MSENNSLGYQWFKQFENILTNYSKKEDQLIINIKLGDFFQENFIYEKFDENQFSVFFQNVAYSSLYQFIPDIINTGFNLYNINLIKQIYWNIFNLSTDYLLDTEIQNIHFNFMKNLLNSELTIVELLFQDCFNSLLNVQRSTSFLCSLPSDRDLILIQ